MGCTELIAVCEIYGTLRCSEPWWRPMFRRVRHLSDMIIQAPILTSPSFAISGGVIFSVTGIEGRTLTVHERNDTQPLHSRRDS